MIDKKSEKDINNLLLFIILFLPSILLSYFFIFDFFLVLSFTIHESGHMIGSVLTDFFSGQPIKIPCIKNTQPSPIWHLPMPQQTHSDAHLSFFLMYGGIVMTFIFFFLVCLGIYWYFSSTKWILGLPFLILIHSIVNDYYCGTDNPTNLPLPECNYNFLVSFGWNFGNVILIIFFAFLITLLLIGKVRDYIQKYAKP